MSGAHLGRVPGSALALSLVVLAAAAAPVFAHPDGSYPRTFNLDWRNKINAQYDARYDMIVTSTRIQNDQYDSLRVFNPAIQRVVSLSWYVYYNAGPSGYAATWGPFDAADPMFGWDRKYWDLLNENDWWLHGRDSSGVRYKAGIWWEMWTGNFSTKCPPNAQGKRLCDVFADFLADHLLTQKHIEGVYFDQCWDDPGHIHWKMYDACQKGTDCTNPATPKTPETEFAVGFDMDEDGVADHPDSIIGWWHEGMKTMMARLRQRMGPNFIIVGNGVHHYADMNGGMHERFPRLHGKVDPAPNAFGYKWNDSMTSPVFGYLGYMQDFFTGPSFNMIDTEHPKFDQFNAVNSPFREAFKRWTLGSTLLGDGYYTAHGPGYGDMWWEPEYDLQLGWPLGPAYTVNIQGITVWRRDFTSGEVWVNPSGNNVAATQTNPAIPYRDAVIRETGSDSISVPSGDGPQTVLAMESPWPNPTTAGSSVRFRADPGQPATLYLFDVSGRLVKELWSGVGTGDYQTALWDGRDERGFDTPAGVYFAVLSAGARTVEARIARVR